MKRILICLVLLGCGDSTLESNGSDAGLNGACCRPSGCSLEFASQCVDGVFNGSQSCDPDPCAQGARGACCANDGACSVAEQNSCVARGDDFQGAGVVCGEGVCPQPEIGACCSPVGVCEIRNEQRCFLDNWTYQGPDSVCEPTPCTQRAVGACCHEDGRCEDLDRIRCGGEFRPGEMCSPDLCERPPTPDVGPLPDMKVPDIRPEDMALPLVDSGSIDARLISDVAPPTPDVAPPTPDVAPPVPDVAPPTPDVAPPVPDLAPPMPDVAPPVPDLAPPVPDMAPPIADGGSNG